MMTSNYINNALDRQKSLKIHSTYLLVSFFF